MIEWHKGTAYIGIAPEIYTATKARHTHLSSFLYTHPRGVRGTQGSMPWVMFEDTGWKHVYGIKLSGSQYFFATGRRKRE